MTPKIIARIMLIAIVGIIAASLLSGCGAVSKLRNKQESIVKNETKTEERITQKQTQVITEKADTNITVPGGKSTLSTTIDALLKGDTIRSEKDGTTVSVFYNPHTEQLLAIAETAAKTVPVHIEKTTITETETEATKDESIHSLNEQKSDISTTEREATIPIYVYIIAFLILLLALLYYFNKSIPKF